MHLDQHLQAQSAGVLMQRGQLDAVQRRDDQQHCVGAGRARLIQLVGIDDEVLAQRRQQRRPPRLLQVLEAAPEELLFGQDGERGRAGHLVGLGGLDRMQVLADDAPRRRAPLELRDHVHLSGSGDGGHERPGQPGGHAREAHLLHGQLAAALVDALARAGHDPRKDVVAAAHDRESSRTRSSRAAARPSSMALEACAAPSGSPPARPATTSAAAALRITTSRFGPRRPPSTSPAIVALTAASPPRSDSGPHGARPASSGVTVKVRMVAPVSSNAATVVGPQSDSSSSPEPWTTHREPQDVLSERERAGEACLETRQIRAAARQQTMKMILL